METIKEYIVKVNYRSIDAKCCGTCKFQRGYEEDLFCFKRDDLSISELGVCNEWITRYT